jgi:hypothetical protein
VNPNEFQRGGGHSAASTPSSRSPLAWRLLHSLWAAIGLVVSAMFAFSWQGHPPGIIFLPLALAGWGAGHLFLWVSRRLAVAGSRLLEARGVAVRWPPSMLLATAATGVVTAGGLALVARLAIDSDAGLDAWTAILLGVWLPHVVCFGALLLRRAWSLWLAAALAVGWALLLVVQLFTTNDPRPWDLPLALALIGGLIALAARLVLSSSRSAAPVTNRG